MTHEHDDELFDLNVLAREFADRVNEWMQHHDRVVHNGEPCHDERANILAYLAHRMGYSRDTFVIMLERVRDYEGLHAEHNHDHD